MSEFRRHARVVASCAVVGLGSFACSDSKEKADCSSREARPVGRHIALVEYIGSTRHVMVCDSVKRVEVEYQEECNLGFVRMSGTKYLHDVEPLSEDSFSLLKDSSQKGEICFDEKVTPADPIDNESWHSAGLSKEL